MQEILYQGSSNQKLNSCLPFPDKKTTITVQQIGNK